MIDGATVERLRRHWEEGWNGGDVDRIMDVFAADVVFSSPFVARVSGDPSATTIEGRDALRSYVTRALERTPGVRYTLHGIYAGTDAVVLVYTAVTPAGAVHEGADSMRVDASGAVVEWRCHYAAAG